MSENFYRKPNGTYIFCENRNGETFSTRGVNLEECRRKADAWFNRREFKKPEALGVIQLDLKTEQPAKSNT